MFLVNTNSDSKKREYTYSERAKREKVCHLRDSVYVRYNMVLYDREGVKFRDGSRGIKRNIEVEGISERIDEK
jgi:hypothetical protein